MSRKVLSASKLWLAESCLAWMRSESEYAWVEGKPSYSARGGSAIHGYAEHYVRYRTDWAPGSDAEIVADLVKEHDLTKRMVEVLENQWKHLREWIDKTVPLTAEVEVPYAYDPFTQEARVLESDGHRDYSRAHDHEMVGTVDLMWPGTVKDYKSGRYIDSTEDSVQMKSLALFISRLPNAGRDYINASIVVVREDGTSEIPHSFDSFALDVQAVSLLRVAEKLRAGHMEPNPGPWCKRCPSRNGCPEAVGQVTKGTMT